MFFFNQNTFFSIFSLPLSKGRFFFSWVRYKRGWDLKTWKSNFFFPAAKKKNLFFSEKKKKKKSFFFGKIIFIRVFFFVSFWFLSFRRFVVFFFFRSGEKILEIMVGCDFEYWKLEIWILSRKKKWSLCPGTQHLMISNRSQHVGMSAENKKIQKLNFYSKRS